MSTDTEHDRAASSRDSEDIQVTRAQRGNKKGLVTRFINNLSRYVVEEDDSAVKETLEKMKTLFKDFEDIHIRYHDQLRDENEIDISDDYFFQAEQAYINAFKSAKDWLRGTARVEASPVKDSNVFSDLHTLINLPKVEIKPFDGNPLDYHSFIATFDELVDKVVTDSRAKLTRLLQSTMGNAKEAIKSCILIRGDDGYQQARNILHQRFGNDHLVTERIIRDCAPLSL